LVFRFKAGISVNQTYLGVKLFHNKSSMFINSVYMNSFIIHVQTSTHNLFLAWQINIIIIFDSAFLNVNVFHVYIYNFVTNMDLLRKI
jgi:hypothetical protein